MTHKNEITGMCIGLRSRYDSTIISTVTLQNRLIKVILGTPNISAVWQNPKKIYCEYPI